MKISHYCTAAILALLPLHGSLAAAPEQCYGYFTELVRSSNFPLSGWGVKPQQVNLIIDEDNDTFIRAKLFIDTDGSGTLGWVLFNKANETLFDTTVDVEQPVELTFNYEYHKAQQSCLAGETVYQVMPSGRLYFYDKTESGLHKSKLFIVKGDYVQVNEKAGDYNRVTYQPASGATVSGWVNASALREVDFINSW